MMGDATCWSLEPTEPASYDELVYRSLEPTMPATYAELVSASDSPPSSMPSASTDPSVGWSEVPPAAVPPTAPPTLPVSGRTLIVGSTGSGKTYAAMLFAERALALPDNPRLFVIDPLGVWWGLAFTHDGSNRSDVPVLLLGGMHGLAIPEGEDNWRALLDALVDDPRSVVLDTSDLPEHLARERTAQFLGWLFDSPPKADARLLIVDESDVLAPERATRHDQPTLRALANCVRRGRHRGLATVLICQRPADLAKTVQTSASVLLALRVFGAHDRGAVLDWFRPNITAADFEAVNSSLSTMPVGQAWLWTPESGLTRITIANRSTFDSSSGPGGDSPRITLTQEPPSPVRIQVIKNSKAPSSEADSGSDPVVNPDPTAKSPTAGSLGAHLTAVSTILVRYPAGLPTDAIALRAGVRPGNQRVAAALKELLALGRVRHVDGRWLAESTQGDAPTRPDQLIEVWAGRLRHSERRLLIAVAAAHPRPVQANGRTADRLVDVGLLVHVDGRVALSDAAAGEIAGTAREHPS